MASLSNRPEVARNKMQYQNNSTVLSFPENKTGHSIVLIFKEFKYEGYLNSSDNNYYNTSQAVGRSAQDRNNQIQMSISGFNGIELPFPKQLSDNTSLRIQAFEREALTETISRALLKSGINEGTISDQLGRAGNAIGMVPGMLADLGKGVASLNTGDIAAAGNAAVEKFTQMAKSMGATNMTDITRGASYLLRETIGKLGGDVARTIDLVNGSTVNPKEALSFEGVDMKSFSFSWELYPSSFTETETIDKIIRLCKRKALPGTQDLIPGVFERTFLSYPATVEIRLVGVNPKYFPRYKPCMIKSVNVGYENAGTIPIMQGGAPAAVTLSMDFMEMTAHTRDDVDDSGISVPPSPSEQYATTPPGID